MYSPHFLYLSFNGHLGYFHKAMFSNAAMNMGMKVSLQELDFNCFRYIQEQNYGII